MRIRRKVIALVSVWTILLVSTFAILNAIGEQLYTIKNDHTIISVAWAGYIVASSFNSQKEVIAVDASWTVPQVNASAGNGYSSAWIGIGGQSDKSLIQIGTEHNLLNSQENYHVWYELLPDYAIRIPDFQIEPGDLVLASIRLVNNESNVWNIQLTDVSNGQSFSRTVTYNSTRSSAEWIVERSTVNNQVTNLADFGSITFGQCRAGLVEKEGVISNFTYSVVHMTNEGLNTLATAAPLNADGAGFAVDYLHSS